MKSGNHLQTNLLNFFSALYSACICKLKCVNKCTDSSESRDKCFSLCIYTLKLFKQTYSHMSWHQNSLWKWFVQKEMSCTFTKCNQTRGIWVSKYKIYCVINIHLSFKNSVTYHTEHVRNPWATGKNGKNKNTLDDNIYFP